MLSVTFSATMDGARGTVVQLQAATENALPQICLTGLPGSVIRESRERVRACLVQHGFDVPSRRIVVNLSPACTPKQGSQLDLAIALTCLAAEQKLDVRVLDGIGVLGELTLDGELRAVPHALPLIEALERFEALHTIVLPAANGREASLIDAKKVHLARSLADVLLFLEKKRPLARPRAEDGALADEEAPSGELFDSIVGQSAAKFALQVALAGRHHLLMIGPPGVGKSLLAAAARDLLPPLTKDEAVELRRIYALAPGVECPESRPFRSPHHTASANAILGGGTRVLSPGEVSLAHSGILFLDELPEFRKDVLEGLREPLEMGEIFVRRVHQNHRLPAQFTLIAAMNPCPCGQSIGGNGCRCSLGVKTQYLKRISGPLADRFDLLLVMSRPPLRGAKPTGLRADLAQENISAAWSRRVQRPKCGGGALMGVALQAEDEEWVREEVDISSMSLRRARKWLAVARTIADLAREEAVNREHLLHAQALTANSFQGGTAGGFP